MPNPLQSLGVIPLVYHGTNPSCISPKGEIFFCISCHCLLHCECAECGSFPGKGWMADITVAMSISPSLFSSCPRRRGVDVAPFTCLLTRRGGLESIRLCLQRCHGGEGVSMVWRNPHPPNLRRNPQMAWHTKVSVFSVWL